MRQIFVRLLSCFCLFLFPFIASAQEFSLPGFGKDSFFESDRNQPDGFSMVKDPVPGTAGNKSVFEFSVVPRPCFNDDCQQQSARSTVQQYNAKHPEESWYGWDMYFPEDFAYGSKQVDGFNIYNEWKDHDNCMLVGLTNFGGVVEPGFNRPDLELSWRMANPNLPGDCKLVLRKPIAEFKDLLGKWNRFEVFIKWSKGKDGKVNIFLDGVLKLDYSGETCFVNCNDKIYYLFGHYICCTANTESIVASKVYYKNISRSKKRSGLKWKD